MIFPMINTRFITIFLTYTNISNLLVISALLMTERERTIYFPMIYQLIQDSLQSFCLMTNISVSNLLVISDSDREIEKTEIEGQGII